MKIIQMRPYAWMCLLSGVTIGDNSDIKYEWNAMLGSAVSGGPVSSYNRHEQNKEQSKSVFKFWYTTELFKFEF